MSGLDEKVRAEREEEVRLLQIGRDRDGIAKANADFFLEMFRESVKNGPTEWDPEQDYDPLWDQMTAEEKQATEANWLRTRRKLANVFHRQRYEELYAYRVKRQAERQKLGYIHDGRGKFDPGREPIRSPKPWTLETWNDFRERAIAPRSTIAWMFDKSSYPFSQPFVLEVNKDAVSVIRCVRLHAPAFGPINSGVRGQPVVELCLRLPPPSWACLPDQLAFSKPRKYRTPELSWTAYLCLRERILTPANSPLRSTAKAPKRSRERQRALEASQFLELQAWLSGQNEFRELAKPTLRNAIDAQRRVEPVRRSRTVTYSEDAPDHNPHDDAQLRTEQEADDHSVLAVPRGLSRLNVIRARVLNSRPIPPRFYTRAWRVPPGALEIWSTSPECKLKQARAVPRPQKRKSAKVPGRTNSKLKLVPGCPRQAKLTNPKTGARRSEGIMR